MSNYKDGIVPFVGDNPDIALAIRLMVENIYDHAKGVGGVFLAKQNSLFRFFVWDAGPGYQGESQGLDFLGLAKQHKNKSRNSGHGGNLLQIAEAWARLEEHDPYAKWQVNTQSNFIYWGHLASFVYERKIVIGSQYVTL